MHVLITVNAAWNVMNFRRPVLEGLIARRHRVTVLAPHDDKVADLQSLGAWYVPLTMDCRGLNPLRDAALILRLFRQFRTVAPDVVLSYTIKNNIFGALAARWTGVPFIPNVSGLGTAFLSGGALQRVAETLYRMAFRKLDTVFFQNSEDRDLFVERRLVRPEQARLLPGSGIDLDRFAPTPLPEGPPTFLMIARLLRDKGVLEYVEAARQVRASHPDVRFQLLGAADTENRTAIGIEAVREWQAEGAIDYLGTSTDVRPQIAAATCVVLPSYREGAPRTLIEGAAMARPLIATDVPGCRSVVDRGRTGFLCEAKSPESLAEACRRFLALPREAQIAMGTAGRQKMEAEFDQKVVVAAYMDAIERVTSGRMDMSFSLAEN
ncbi:glycosyltransferase family 4 protein (plasmid) [Cereibacter azotoformans]|uniref:glycosyltransferase family 4 protein n=1 Tax=Cereibacter azotoformans TaxID=43057 RepID=UPI003B21951E